MRERFLLHLASSDRLGVKGVALSSQEGAYSLNQLQEYYDTFVGEIVSERFIYDWADAHHEGVWSTVTYSDLVYIRFEMFVQSLVVTGVLEPIEKDGEQGYAFAHKTVMDYYRSMSIDADSYRESGYYEDLKFFWKLWPTAMFQAWVIDSDFVTEYSDLFGREYLPKIWASVDALLDAVFFDGYDGLMNIVWEISMEQWNDNVRSALASYMYANRNDIVWYFTDRMKVRYPDATQMQVLTYSSVIASFFWCRPKAVWPTMREHACAGIKPTIDHLLRTPVSRTSAWIDDIYTYVEQGELSALQWNLKVWRNIHPISETFTRLEEAKTNIELRKTEPHNQKLEFVLGRMSENLDFLEEMCFGPITELHASMYVNQKCFGDDMEDILAAERIVAEKNGSGDVRFVR